jgi:hypothetical protein
MRRKQDRATRSTARARLFIVLFLAGLSAGCAAMAAGARDNPFGGRDAVDGRVTMEVQNLLNEEVVVRVRGTGIHRELGRVASRSNQRFTFPWAEFERLTIQLEPFSGNRHSMPPVAVGAGELLELLIQSPIERSVLRR